MKAWVLKSPGDIVNMVVKDPVPGDSEVLLKVKACGICGSDIDRVYVSGAHNMPLVIGHEFSGEVAATGANVPPHIKKGMRAAVFPMKPCMTCDMCKKEHYELCSSYDYYGSRCDGGFAEAVAVNWWNLVDIGDLPFEVAALCEPAAVAIHAFKSLKIEDENAVITVSGLGPVGLLLCAYLKYKGFKRVIGLGKRDIQRRFVDEYYDVSKTSPETLNNTSDYSFEAVGSSENISNLLNIAKPLSKICLIGNPKSDINLERNDYWRILRKELRLTGTWNSSYASKDNDWQDAIRFLQNTDCSGLITHRLTFDEVDKGLLMMRDKTEEYIKVMMVNDR